MAGLLSPDEQSQINNDALMGLGMGLLSASGPSRVPVSLGQALGQGMQGMQQSRSHAEQMAMKKRQMEQEAQHNAMLNEMNQMKLEEMKRQNQNRTSASEYVKGLDPEAQQYAAATGDFKGAFEMHRQKQFMNQVGGAMGGGMQEAPRPFSNQVNPGQFQVSNDQQANTLMDDLKKLEAINPQEAAKVRESLVQQGLIKPTMQQTHPNVDALARMGALGAMQGIKGADKLIDYAKFSKPEWATLDNGGALYGYNKNSQQNPFGNSPIVKQMSPDAAASNALGRDRFEFEKTQANKPVFNDNVGGFMRPPVGDSPPVVIQPVDAQGKTVVSNKPLTETQGKAAGFADRMAEAEKIMSNPNLSGHQKPEVFAETLKAIPSFGVGNVAGNKAESAGRQQVRNAQENWVRANLRLESGAVIGPEEMKQEIITYFPQIGDSHEVIEQKRQSRVISQKAVARQGGPRYENPAESRNSVMSSGGWSATVIK